MAFFEGILPIKTYSVTETLMLLLQIAYKYRAGFMKNSLKRRHELDIYYDLLQAALSGSKKSHLAGEVRINYQRLSEHMDVLVRNDLILLKNEGNSEVYYTSKKGLHFIELFNNLTSTVNYYNTSDL